MHFSKFFSISFILVTTFCCSNNQINNQNVLRFEAVSNINPANNSTANGSVHFTELNGIVELNASINGLTPGNHAIHIHEFGDCSSFDAKSAGGHWNPKHTSHGEWGNDHFHLGDIGNIIADSNGFGEFSLKTNLWCLNCNDSSKNIIGKSIIIHASADDFTSQPSGAAGKRIGCGVIEIK